MKPGQTVRENGITWLVRAAVALVLASAGAAPSLAQAQHGAGEATLGALVLLTPSVGTELGFGGDPDPQQRLLLSWPVQVSIDGSFFEGRPGVHRLVLTPELTVGRGTALRGRLGYRWLRRPVFVGIGLSGSRSLRFCASPEAGYRIWEGDGPNVYVLLRSEVALSSAGPERWAASLAIGWAFF